MRYFVAGLFLWIVSDFGGVQAYYEDNKKKSEQVNHNKLLCVKT